MAVRRVIRSGAVKARGSSIAVAARPLSTSVNALRSTRRMSTRVTPASMFLRSAMQQPPVRCVPLLRVSSSLPRTVVSKFSQAWNAVASRSAHHSSKGCFMSLRKFAVREGVDMKGLINMCDQEFVALLRKSPEFIAYYATVTDDQHYFSMSLYSTEEAMHKSREMAADWIAKNVADKMSLVSVDTGPTVVHHDEWSKMLDNTSTS